jgi:hypothetical protein
MTRVFDREAGRIAALEAARGARGGVKNESVGLWELVVEKSKSQRALARASGDLQLIKKADGNLHVCKEKRAKYTDLGKMSIDYLCE